MIRNAMKITLIILVAIVVNFNKKISFVEEKINIFYESVYEGLTYKKEDEFFLCFDYEYLETLIDKLFFEYERSIDKESESSFLLKVRVQEKFLFKEIKFRVYLRKGDLYD